MGFKDRLRECRLKKDLSQENLAKMIGVAYQTIQKYENGTITNVPLSKVEELAVILGVTPAYLVDWEPKLTKPAAEDGDRLLDENIRIFRGLNQAQQLEVLRYLRYFASLRESD